MEPTDIYNNLTKVYREFLMDETMDLSAEFNMESQTKEVATKLMDKVYSEMLSTDAFATGQATGQVIFTEIDFNENRDALIEMFAEMIIEMMEY